MSKQQQDLGESLNELAMVRQRIEKELAKVGKQQAADEAKLGNPKFRERAALEIVAETEARLRGVTEQRQKLETLLQELSR